MHTVYMPNGMGFEVWSPVAVRHNNNYTLAWSTILKKLHDCQLMNLINYILSFVHQVRSSSS